MVMHDTVLLAGP